MSSSKCGNHVVNGEDGLVSLRTCVRVCVRELLLECLSLGVKGLSLRSVIVLCPCA